MTNRSIIRITIGSSLVLFVVSLTQKSHCMADECGDAVMCFLLGVFGVFYEFFELLTGIYNVIIGKGFTANPKIGATFSWLANPLILLSFIVLRKNSKVTLVLSSVATAFILSFLFSNSVLATEAGHYHKITSYEAGYWLWLMSSLIVLIGSLILTKRDYSINPTNAS